MFQLQLSDQEKSALAEVLESFLGELRNEVTHTDRQEYRERLRTQEHLLKALLLKVQQA